MRGAVQLRIMPVMTRIPLSRPGKFALVDDRDAPRVTRHRWHLQRNTSGSEYAVRAERVDGKQRGISMHRELLGLHRGDRSHVRHLSKDGLDNRRKNLRKTTRAGVVAGCQARPAGIRYHGTYLAQEQAVKR